MDNDPHLSELEKKCLNLIQDLLRAPMPAAFVEWRELAKLEKLEKLAPGKGRARARVPRAGSGVGVGNKAPAPESGKLGNIG